MSAMSANVRALFLLQQFEQSQIVDRTGKRSEHVIPPQPTGPTLSSVKNAYWNLHLNEAKTN